MRVTRSVFATQSKKLLVNNQRRFISNETVKHHAQQHQPKGVSHLFGDLIIDRGEGSWLFNDTNGKKYLDFT
jgi:4-aminobutyrate aminotransferase-like enzyme